MWKRLIKTKIPVVFHEQQEPGLYLIENADDLLKRYQSHVYELKQLISVTAADYHYFYLNLIKSAAVFMQQLPNLLFSYYNKHYGLLTLALERTIAALKYRRAYMLPVGADTETCYKEQDVWTYALFTVALLKDIAQVIDNFEVVLLDCKKNAVKRTSFLQPFPVLQASYYQFNPIACEQRTKGCDTTALIQALLPETGLVWIKTHDELFKLWWNSFIPHPLTNNVLADIICKVEAAITKTNVINTHVSQQTDEEINDVEINSEKIEPAPKSLVEPKIILQPESPAKIAENNLPLAERFIGWLSHAIEKNTLTINQPDSVLHHVAEGILVVMPVAYEQFQANEGHVEIVATKRDKQHFLKKLQVTDYFIKKSSHVLQRYYWGDWHARQLIEGVMIKPTVLFCADVLPPLNPHLHLDPELNA